MKIISLLLGCLCFSSAWAASDLDLTIHHYQKSLSADGVSREIRYSEKMLRRPAHVWLQRILPNVALAAEKSHEHKHFNPVLLPRHIHLDKQQARVEYIDFQKKDRIYIPEAEYDNINFDGSWEHAFYLLDLNQLKKLPRSSRSSPIAGATWFESERNGRFQRVLWSETQQIPLIIESGDQAGTVLQRMEIKLEKTLQTELPWQGLTGFAQREYSDFLD